MIETAVRDRSDALVKTLLDSVRIASVSLTGEGIGDQVAFLRKRLDGMTVVDKPPSDPGRVYFGAWVTLEDDDGKQTKYRIVGPDEFDQGEGYISMDAPLARALMRKALDDEVKVALPGGERSFVVVEISYE